MSLGQRFGDGQPKAEPAETSLQRLVSLLERVKNALQDFLFHSDPVIADGDGEILRRRIGGGDRDFALVAGEFDRVFQQVPDDLLELGGVARDEMSARPKIEVDLDVAGARLCGANLGHIGDRLVGVHFHEIELQFVFGDTRKIEQIVDQLTLQFDIATNHGEGRAGLFGIDGPGFERFHRGQNGRQRCAQFVRKHGEESVLGPVGRLDRGFLLLDGGFSSSPLRHGGRQSQGGHG